VKEGRREGRREGGGERQSSDDGSLGTCDMSL
jgi:hypothetical protein